MPNYVYRQSAARTVYFKYYHFKTLYQVMVTQTIATLNPSKDFNNMFLHPLI